MEANGKSTYNTLPQENEGSKLCDYNSVQLLYLS